MTNVTPFTPRPKVETQPDADQVAIVVKDGKPERWFKFVVDYKDGDATFCFDIWALDAADAERRVAAIRATAEMKGMVYSAMPYP